MVSSSGQHHIWFYEFVDKLNTTNTDQSFTWVNYNLGVAYLPFRAL